MCPMMTSEGKQWFQIGVSSWNTGCGRVGRPGVYARISTFTSWIKDVIQNNT